MKFIQTWKFVINEWLKWETQQEVLLKNKQLINENNKLKTFLENNIEIINTIYSNKWIRVFDIIKLNNIISIIKHIGLSGKKLNALHLFTRYSQIQTNENLWNNLIKRFNIPELWRICSSKSIIEFLDKNNTKFKPNDTGKGKNRGEKNVII